jgi:hypothetical protein
VTTSAIRETQVASEMAVGELVTELESIYGAALRVVLRFGSAVAGEVLPGQSDTNLLIIVDAVSLDSLLHKSLAVQKWTQAGNPAPLLLTLAEWRSSSDIFAMEYADILHRHEVLSGSPPFDGIQVVPADLRLHVERETMGKLLQLRRAIMAVGDTPAKQLQLLINGLSTMMVLFRGVTRVAGSKPPMDYLELSRGVATLAGFDATPFERLVRHARREVQIPAPDVRAVLVGVMDALTRLTAHLDRASGSARFAGESA